MAEPKPPRGDQPRAQPSSPVDALSQLEPRQGGTRRRDRTIKLIVGLAVVLTLLGSVVVIWLGRTDTLVFGTRFQLHAIVDHAQGIRDGAPVTLAGLRVGHVSAVGLRDDGRIRISLSIRQGYQPQIRGDSALTIAPPIVGNTKLDISLGSSAQPVLRDGQEIVVRLQPSMDEIMASVPDKLARLDDILGRLDSLSGQLIAPGGPVQRSLGNLDRTLANAASFSDELASPDGSVNRIMANVERLTKAAEAVERLVLRLDQVADSADATMAVARGTLASVDKLLDDEVPPLITDLRGATGKLNNLAGELDAMVSENRRPINEFSTEGLLAITRLVDEVRFLVSSTTILVERLESDAAGLLLRGQQGGFKAE